MNKNSLFYVDWHLLFPVIVLVTMSLVTLFSLDFAYFKSQAIFLIFTFFIYIFFSQTNYRVLNIYSIPIYIASIVLLALIFFIGVESRGALRWVEFLGFRLQFSEVLKPFLAISFTSLLIYTKNSDSKSFIKMLLLLFPITFLIFLQPDLGNALIYAGVAIFTMFYIGFPIKYFIFSFITLLLTFPIAWSILYDYQRQRVLTFLNPGSDPLGTSYNVIQSVIAIGSGMFLGKGLGQGTQSGLRFLPERHTDFIFASISEQLGFVGALIIIIAFGFLIFRIYTIISESNEKFVKTFAAVTFFCFLVQVLINVGMNIGIVPIVGVTLPFVSYGGSSLLSNFIFLGFLTSISRSLRDREVLEIK